MLGTSGWIQMLRTCPQHGRRGHALANLLVYSGRSRQSFAIWLHTDVMSGLYGVLVLKRLTPSLIDA